MPVWAWAPQPADKASDGGYTRGQHALYMRVKFAGQVVGLAQNISYSVHTGNTPINGIGDPRVENKPGMLYFDGSIEAISIRKRKFFQLAQMNYPNVQADKTEQAALGYTQPFFEIDFRTLPFELEVDFRFLSASGRAFENTNEKLHGVWLQDWTTRVADPNSYKMESISFWAMGYTYSDGGTVQTVMGTLPDPAPHKKKTPAEGVKER